MSEVLTKLDNLSDAAAQESEGKKFMDPVKPAKRGRGRPKGSKAAPQPEPEASWTESEAPPQSKEDRVAALRPLTDPFAKMISSVGERIAEDPRGALEPQEQEAMSTALAGCLDRYMPGLFSAHADLVVLVMISGSYALRVQALRAQSLAKLRAKMQFDDAQTVNMPATNGH